MDEIEVDGVVRRNGTLLPEPGYVCGFPPTSESPLIPRFNDDEIRLVITDPNRRKSDILFPAEDGYISDQLSTSACAGHATGGLLSNARVLRGLPRIILSGSFVYANSKPEGQDSGSTLDANMQTIVRLGSCRAELCTANMIHRSQITKTAYDDASMHKGLSAYHPLTKQDFRTGAAAGFPANVVVHAGPNFSKFTKVNSGSPCNLRAGVDRGRGNHSVRCLDFRVIDGEELFLIANSWNARWGAGGYAWVSWDSFAEPFQYHPFFFVASSAESDVPLGQHG